MNYSDFRFTLDVQIHQAQVSVPVTFGDSARRLCIGLTDGRKPYVIAEGCRAVFNAKKPDGKVIKNDCIIERNVILYEFTEQTTNSEGIVYCDITIYDADGKVLTSPQFTIVVDKRVVRDGEVVISEDQYTALDNIFTREAQRQVAETARAKAEGARSDAETARDDAEQARAEAENNRDVGENLRKDAEDRREKAEGARIQAENERIENEEARDVAEFVRNEAELQRGSKEAERQATFETNEAARDMRYGVAEDARDSGFNTKEAARQTAFNTKEAERQTTFEANEANRQATFTAAETKRGADFDAEVAARAADFNAEKASRKADIDKFLNESDIKPTAEIIDGVLCLKSKILQANIEDNILYIA